MTYEFVQIEIANETVLVTKDKNGNTHIDIWDKEYGKISDKINEIPIKASDEDPNEIILGLFCGIEFRMFKINNQYWLPRVFLERFHSNIARQFQRLKKEIVKEFNKFWLEEGEDFIHVDINEFGQKYGWTFFPPAQKGGQAVFLSPIGSIRLLSRASKTNNVLYWLTVQYKELKLIQFEYYHEKTKELERERKKLQEYKEIIQNEMKKVKILSKEAKKLLELIILQNIKHLNKQIHYWYIHYKGDNNFGYHPHQEIKKKWFCDEAKYFLTYLNKLNNNGKKICRDCGKEGKNMELHHFWKRKDYFKKEKWKKYFDPSECGLVHRDCHERLTKKQQLEK